MSEFSSWMNVIIDPTSRHSKHCAYIGVVALLHAGQFFILTSWRLLSDSTDWRSLDIFAYIMYAINNLVFFVSNYSEVFLPH